METDIHTSLSLRLIVAARDPTTHASLLNRYDP